MKLALDTNRYVDLMRGDREVRALVEGARTVLVPFVVLAELRAGFAVGAQGRANERFLQRFLAKPGVVVVWATDATTHHHAALYRQLRQQGTPVPTNDLWIAALVTEHGARLCTRDAHFGHLAQLDVV
ncbi:MAG: type II toxin-antitoxin system VapC family toxin [Polyangiales bacterium]